MLTLEFIVYIALFPDGLIFMFVCFSMAGKHKGYIPKFRPWICSSLIDFDPQNLNLQLRLQ
jgi:hypothetical protein